MKSTVFIVLILLLTVLYSKSQSFSIRLFATDNIGNKDTIEFGLKYNATMGIDSIYNEHDIYLQPLNDLDIRVIQRDSIEHNCLKEFHWPDNSNASNIYYNTNRDSKIDIRPPSGAFGTINMNFEIFIKSQFPPVYITTDFYGIHWNFYEYYSAIHRLNNSCNTLETKSIYYSGQSDTLFILNSNITTLVAEFQHEVGVGIINDSRIYINSGNDKIKIEYDYPVNIKLYDISGRIIYNSNSKVIYTNSFSKGVYFIKIFDEQNSLLKSEKVFIH